MTSHTSSPSFVVVGHPNKGKSSIVATLAQDESVEIGQLPGTTTRSKTYPMSIENTILYSLIDTPGFQRPRKLLEWLKARETTLANRPDVIREFISDEKNRALFPDEFELLTPLITLDAGIVYVVDGSIPYSADYEAEMEILQWSGQPRLALINPIGNSEFVDQWRVGLRHFFGIVKVFNPMSSAFEGRLEVLRAFGQLSHLWQEPLEKAYQLLEAFRQRQLVSSSRTIAYALIDVLKYEVVRTISIDTSIELVTEELTAELMSALRKIEKKCWADLNSVYLQTKVSVKDDEFEILKSDLFSEESFRFFGLSHWQLLLLGSLSGGAAGGLIDLAVGGSSFFIGSLVGASVGALATQFSLKNLMRLTIFSLPLGRKRVVLALSKNVTTPFVFLARARLYHHMIANRPHSHRNTAELGRESCQALSQEMLLTLNKLFKDARTTNNISEFTDRLVAAVHSCLGAVK